MATEHKISRYRHWYRKLLRFYPRRYRDRFAEAMEQTFNDLCRERIGAEEGLLGFVAWAFFETSVAIIRENAKVILMQNRNVVRIAVVTGLLLLVPLLGRAPWTLLDFVVAGTLLFGAGLTYELVARRGSTTAYRVAVGVACAAALLLIWLNLAVGLIGSEDNPANLLYAGVIATLGVGSAIARFEPPGMARALFATAIAQALVPLIALTIWRPPINSGVVEVFGVNAFFVGLWVISALLFRNAASRWSNAPGEAREPGASQ